MKKAYIYPHSAKDKELGVYNPYIDDFIKSFSRYFTIINLNKPTNSGVFDILKNIFRVQFIFLHWIEKVPEKKGGLIQTLVLFFILYASGIFGYKVIWTMHNKFTHSGKNRKLIMLIFKTLLKRSFMILTHSSEGIEFGETLVPGSSKKIVYYPHPVKDRRTEKRSVKEIDILIWGSIAPYKGIDKFLTYFTENKLDEKYSIYIVGKIYSPDYAKILMSFQNKNIHFHAEYISNEELAQLINKSNTVLFTYSKDSILSSGVLMDSIGFGARILGPHVGAFADLQKINVVTTYNSFSDLPELLDMDTSHLDIKDDKTIEKFIINNSWDKYAENVIHRLK